MGRQKPRGQLELDGKKMFQNCGEDVLNLVIKRYRFLATATTKQLTSFIKWP
jgi:hypothetical protein